MIEQHIGALPVLESGRLVGIVTETNLVAAFRDLCRDPAHADELDRPVEEVMHSLVVTVEPEIIDQGLAKKIIIFKYKRRKGYHRTVGHRRQLTRLKIKSITA